jgi:lambda family phage portal protein
MASFFDRIFGRSAKVEETSVTSAGKQRIVRGARAEYDGATVGRRAAGWRRTTRDANGELSPAANAALRGVARDLVRNNPYAARGVAEIAANIVGPGITFQVYRNGVIDDALNLLARRHFDTTDCDATGRHDLYGLQLQAARTIVESGAAVVRRRWRRRSDRLPLPMQLQVLEPDYIDPSKHGPLASATGVNAGFVVNGIQFSPLGKREGYWLYSGHPGAARVNSLASTFVAAGDVAHVFRADRPEQEHGATWFAPVILRLKDFGDYEDAQLTRQKIAAAFAGFVKGDDESQFPGIGNDAVNGDDIGSGEPLDFVEPGTLQYLRPGEDITFANPPGVDGYLDYSKVSLRAVSAGLGVPYEIITGDLSNVSFISGRLGRLDYKRSVSTWQWLMFIPQFCASVERWFKEAAEIEGHDITGVTMRWTPPRTEMLDPASEVPANRDAVRSGQKTLSQVVRENGDDPDTFFAEMAADAARLDALGLILDSDPRRVTAVGNPTQPKPATGEGNR